MYFRHAKTKLQMTRALYPICWSKIQFLNLFYLFGVLDIDIPNSESFLDMKTVVKSAAIFGDFLSSHFNVDFRLLIYDL